MTSSRRRFLSGLFWNAAAITVSMAPKARAGSIQSTRSVGSVELDEITIGSLQDGMRGGRYSAQALVRKYLARIKAIDAAGPSLRSVIEINPDALAIAAALDRERAQQGPRGPLHGIPVIIKDNIDTADRMATTAGSLALVGATPPHDAHLVGKLAWLGRRDPRQDATSANGPTSVPPVRRAGGARAAGLRRNPYALDRNTSGSSSGSAVAVAASLCVVAVGTETDGSIVSPASINGIVGIKPTVGLVSRTGIIPISHTQDTAGPMARTVRDAAILLRRSRRCAIPRTRRRPPAVGTFAADYTRYLDENALQGARIGVARNYFGFHDGVDAVMRDALEVMRKSGRDD